MNYKKFDKEDVIRNNVKTHPEYSITFYSGSVYNNSLNQVFSTDEKNSYIAAGNTVNFLTSKNNYSRSYELNAVNPTISFLLPLNLSFSDRYNHAFQSNFELKNFLTSSVTVIRTTAGSNDNKKYISALKNTLDWYSSVSPSYSSDNFLNKDVAIVNIPSCFFGSTIKRQSVQLSYFFSGTLVSRLEDKGSSGDLVVTYGTNSGSSAGVVLYDEGFILLSGSWNLSSAGAGKWTLFGSASSNDASYKSGSYVLDFKGTNNITTLTMMAHADKNEINSSNNKTYIYHGQENYNQAISSSNLYEENSKIKLKNTIYSPFSTVSASYQKQTFVNKIGIYDQNKNLIAIAKLATPVKKNSERDYTFKLKLDI